ncbi:MAG: lipid A export permease/ATP-binding protein MsbA [Deltaproteobacteria bacterium]|nr:lipid A export permease/ATP-binding protein MsbA [Deltaproteobacteria bacterium]
MNKTPSVGLYRRLLAMVKPYWTKLALAMMCLGMVGACTGAMAYLVKDVIDGVFVAKNIWLLKILPPAIVVLFLFKGLFSYGQSYLMTYVGERVVANIRNGLYRHIINLSTSYFDKNATGMLISRVTNDVAQIQGAVSGAVTGSLKEVSTVVCLLVVIFIRNWELAIWAVLVFPIAVIPLVKFGRRLRKISTRSQETMARIVTILHETISGNRIVKTFCMEEYEAGRFEKENEQFFLLEMKNARVRAISSPLMELLGGFGIAFIVGYGGYQVVKGTSTPGTFFSFLTALIMLYDPVRRLAGVNNTVQQGVAAAIRVFDVMDTPPEIQERPDPLTLTTVKSAVTFDRVVFGYNDKPVLKNLCLSVSIGEVLAVVGTSGGGKTSLVNLIPRLYDVWEGSVLIDGRDVRDFSLRSLRSQVAMVSQQTILFNDTVRNNIAYGCVGMAPEEVERAAEQAYAVDFIQALGQGFDTIIGEQGAMLSGGERQRLSIARAILKDAPILILDEATSSLDTESEFAVQKALENLMKGRTTFVIAHRLSTIRNADRIIVIDDGTIAEEGKHEDLLARSGLYRKLYDMQFKQEE